MGQCCKFECLKWQVVCSLNRTQGCRNQQQGYLFQMNAVTPHKTSQQAHTRLVTILQPPSLLYKHVLLPNIHVTSLLPSTNTTHIPEKFRLRHYRSCLLLQGNISRLILCLVRIELKLRRFRKPTFIGLKSGAGCTTYLTSKLISGVVYLTSISQALTSQYLSA